MESHSINTFRGQGSISDEKKRDRYLFPSYSQVRGDKKNTAIPHKNPLLKATKTGHKDDNKLAMPKSVTNDPKVPILSVTGVSNIAVINPKN